MQMIHVAALAFITFSLNFTDSLDLILSATSFSVPSYIKNLSTITTCTFPTSRSSLECAVKAVNNPTASFVHFNKASRVCSFLKFENKTISTLNNVLLDVNKNSELWMLEDAWERIKALVDGTATKLNLTTANPVKQESMGYEGVAPRALDGNTSPIYEHNSCMHTAANKTSPVWWLVDVQDIVYLQKVTVFNRVQYNLEGFFQMITVGISQLEEAWNATSSLSQFSLCQKFEGPAAVTPQDVQFNCVYPLQKGRYVVERRRRETKRDEDATALAMHFCEVQVYAFKAD